MKYIYKNNLFKRIVTLFLIVLMLTNCIITSAISPSNNIENITISSNDNINDNDEMLNDNSQQLDEIDENVDKKEIDDILSSSEIESSQDTTNNNPNTDTSETDTTSGTEVGENSEDSETNEKEEEKEEEPIIRDYEAAYADESANGTLIEMITSSLDNKDKKEIVLYKDVIITQQINLSTNDYLNINLNDHIITRTNNDDIEDGRLFCVTEGATLILNNGTLDGGKTISNGGCIYLSNDSTLTLTNIIINNNYAKNGSAVYAGSNSRLTLDNSTINGNDENNDIVIFSKGTIIIKNNTEITKGIVCVDNELQKNVMFTIDNISKINTFKISSIKTPTILVNSTNHSCFTLASDNYKIININGKSVLIKDEETQASYTSKSNDVVNGSLEEMWGLALLYGNGKVTLLKDFVGNIGSDDEMPATPKWVNNFYQMSTGIDSDITFDFNGHTLDANMYELVKKAEDLEVERSLGANFIFAVNQGSTLTLIDSVGGGGIKNVISGSNYPSAVNICGTATKQSHLIVDNINITNCSSGKGVIWSNNEFGDIKLSGNIVIKNNTKTISETMGNNIIGESLNLYVDENTKIEADLLENSEIYITVIEEKKDNTLTISRNTIEDIFKSEEEDFVFIIYNNTLKLVHISETQPNDISEPNPKYIVQFYANLPTLATSGTNALPLINTSWENNMPNMPINKGNTSSSPTRKNLSSMYVDSNGNVEIEIIPTEIFKEKEFEYYKAPTINYMNELVQNSNYILKEVWVLKEGRSPEGINPSAWDIHTYNEDLHFTNRAVSAENKQYILIQNGTTLRLVYDTTSTNANFKTEFYDYDITNGRVHRAKPPEDPNQYVYKTAGETFSGDELTSNVLDWASGLKNWDGHLYAYTKEQGINSSSNYSGSGTKFAFGNVNTGTNLGRLTWNHDDYNNELNKYNNKGYLGCTFSLVKGLDKNGNIIYADGINTPKLFNEGDATGKTSYNNNEYSLKFNRNGDTYTLIAVNGTEINNLNKFTNPKNSQGNYDGNHGDGIIWTNNFWPMDYADSYSTGTHDIKFGGSETFKEQEHELRFGPITQKGTDYTFPESDDGLYHNSYFGMHYSVTFDLIEDYIGPLNYYFYGDDDMWVFLDGKLICDIGGVHSSVGEYVDLRDYLPNGSSGTHELQFFYTERGASGSTCWMQFTLPSIIIETPELTHKDYGDLTISKTVSQLSSDTIDLSSDEFNFTINLTNENGNQLADDYAYSKYDKNGNEISYNLVIWNGGTFSLKNGEYIVIKYLPKNTKYSIEEISKTIINDDISDENKSIDYYTDIIINGVLSDDKTNLTNNKIAIGDISNITSNDVEYNNKTYFSTKTMLPDTGSNDAIILQNITLSILLIGIILFILTNKKK